ncbi:MAG: FHA domain-containing protein [Anaerolineae bacterium]|nr:FHA domain-containing protein [Anaerolineae bacterium]
MSNIIITLRLPDRTLRDLEVPDDVPARRLVPALVEGLGLPALDARNQPALYELVWHVDRTPHVLRPSDTLGAVGVTTAHYVSLDSANPLQPGHSPTEVLIDARLRCPSGRVYMLSNLGKPELSLGRYDARTGNAPDIELSEEPSGNTVSRTHAVLTAQGGGWILTVLTASSPTLLDGKKLSPNQSVPLASGMVIQLGSVSLTFEVG